MKVKLLLLTTCLLLQVSILAQTNFATIPTKITDPNSRLSLALEFADRRDLTSDIQTAVDAIKLIESTEPGNWLATYYVAYLETVQSFYAESARKDTLLEAAYERIGKLLDETSADQSEIYNLLGYYFFARVDQDPENNGEIYYREGVINYHKAIYANPLNPRPRYLLILFEDKTNRYVGKNSGNICDKLKRSRSYFSNFKVSHINNPDWGEEELSLEIMRRCTEKQ